MDDFDFSPPVEGVLAERDGKYVPYADELYLSTLAIEDPANLAGSSYQDELYNIICQGGETLQKILPPYVDEVYLSQTMEANCRALNGYKRRLKCLQYVWFGHQQEEMCGDLIANSFMVCPKDKEEG